MASYPSNVGFIGLGIMGYPMAVNLISKLPDTSKLYVYDISAKTLTKLQEETSARKVQISECSKEVAEKSVSSRRNVCLELVSL